MIRNRSLASILVLAALVACGESSGPNGPVTITGASLLATVNGSPVPFEVVGPGGSARITGGTLRLNANGRYTFAIASRVNTGPGPVWEVSRGAGTFTTQGNTVRFSDSGDGSGPFTGTASGDRLTFVEEGVTLAFVLGVVIDEVTVTPAQVDLTSCVPLQLAATARNSDSGQVQTAAIAWQSSNESIATVDGAGRVTSRGVGTVSIFATAGSGVDSTVVAVSYSVPSPVTLQPVIWENGYPKLTWSQADPAQFCYYRVLKDGNHFGIPSGQSDSIPDVATTTFVDQSVVTLQGLSLDYQILVRNGPQTAASQPAHAEYGLSIPFVPYADRTYRPLVSPMRDELYLRGGIPNTTGLSDTLTALSTASDTVVNQRFIGMSPFAVSADGAALYVLSHFPEFNTDSLITIDPATFSRTAVVPVPFATPQPGSIIAGRAGRLYVGHVDYGVSASIKILDVATGTLVGTVLASTDPAQFSTGLLALSPDYNTLYVARSNRVWRIDVTTDSAVVLDSADAAYEIQALQLSPDGGRLYLGHFLSGPNIVERWDAASLTRDRSGLRADDLRFLRHGDRPLRGAGERRSPRGPVLPLGGRHPLRRHLAIGCRIVGICESAGVDRRRPGWIQVLHRRDGWAHPGRSALSQCPYSEPLSVSG